MQNQPFVAEGAVGHRGQVIKVNIAASLQLKGQLRAAQAGESRSESTVGAQLGNLELLLGQREEEVRTLRQALSEQERLGSGSIRASGGREEG